MGKYGQNCLTGGLAFKGEIRRQNYLQDMYCNI